MLMGPTLLFTREPASAAKPKAEQPIEATEIDNNQSESNYQRVDSVLV